MTSPCWWDTGDDRDTKYLQILYVEDNDDNWEIANLRLSDKFVLTRAKTDAEAFGLLREHGYDVILMDIQLQGSQLDGLEITRAIKGREVADQPSYADGVDCGDTPVIFVTAYTARYDRSELMAAGGDELIGKPVDFAQLTSAIVRLSMAHP